MLDECEFCVGEEENKNCVLAAKKMQKGQLNHCLLLYIISLG